MRRWLFAGLTLLGCDVGAVDAWSTLDAGRDAGDALTNDGGLPAYVAEPDAEAPVEAVAAGGLLLIVAHPDDDLLFAGAELFDARTRGTPVTTLVLTAGNADFPCLAYAQGREEGLRAAYASWFQVDDVWTESTRTVSGHTLRALALTNAPVTLLFAGLRDSADHDLSSLWRGDTAAIDTWELDARRPRERYDRNGLRTMLATLVDQLAPERVSINDASQLAPPLWPFDHDDHIHAGLFALWALDTTRALPAVRMHRAYGIQFDPPNLAADVADAAWRAFEIYMAHDEKLCAGLGTTICGVFTECDVPGTFYEVLAGRGYPVGFVEGHGQIAVRDEGCLGEREGTAQVVDCASATELTVRARGIENDAGECLTAGDVFTFTPCVDSPLQVFRLSDRGQLRAPGGECVRFDRWLSRAPCSDDAHLLSVSLVQRSSSSSARSAAMATGSGPR